MGKSHDQRSGVRRQDFDRNRSDYGGDNYNDSFRSRPVHQPPQWNEVKTLTNGGAQAVISSATVEDGKKLYSFTVGRSPFGTKPASKFLTSKDIADTKGLLGQVEAWIEADRNGGIAVKVSRPIPEAARID